MPCKDYIANGIPRGACWNTTLADYLEREEARLRECGNCDIEACLRVARVEHRSEVKWAIEDGLRVPRKVMLDYPGVSTSRRRAKNAHFRAVP